MAQSETTGHHTSDRTAQPEGLHLDPGCPKCGGKVHREERIRTTGDRWSRFFNLQNQRFRARVCVVCRYTELYRLESSLGSNLLDAFFGT